MNYTVQIFQPVKNEWKNLYASIPDKLTADRLAEDVRNVLKGADGKGQPGYVRVCGNLDLLGA